MSLSSRAHRFTQRLEENVWLCSSFGFSFLSSASPGRSDPQTSAASHASTLLMRTCCSRSPQSAPSGCSRHQTLSVKKQVSCCSVINLACEVKTKRTSLSCAKRIVCLSAYLLLLNLRCMLFCVGDLCAFLKLHSFLSGSHVCTGLVVIQS